MVAANFFLCFHMIWIFFMVLGLPMGIFFRSSVIRIIHGSGMGVVAFLNLFGLPCPLTVWEEAFRKAVDPAFSYNGSFIITLMDHLVYPRWITPSFLQSITVAWFLATIASFFIFPFVQCQEVERKENSSRIKHLSADLEK